MGVQGGGLEGTREECVWGGWKERGRAYKCEARCAARRDAILHARGARRRKEILEHTSPVLGSAFFALTSENELYAILQRTSGVSQDRDENGEGGGVCGGVRRDERRKVSGGGGG